MGEDDRAQRFDAALTAAWEAWRSEAGYIWRRFKPMVRAYGAVGTAKRQVVKPGISPGFQKLKDAGRLDLTIEALVLERDYLPLFSEAERSAARKRLRESGYTA